jgi:ferredoxin-nitrite reductase
MRVGKNRAGSWRRRYPPHGLADLRLSGVSGDKVALATAAIEAIGLAIKTSEIRAGLIACTGGLAASSAMPTPRAAAGIANWCDHAFDRDADQHPYYRLPPFLRAAVHQRHRRSVRASRSMAATPSTAFVLAAGLVLTPSRAGGVHDVTAEDAPVYVDGC